MSEFYDLFSKYTKIDEKFIVFLPNDEKLPEVENGIVFVMACWSGNSIYQLSLLTNILSKIELGKIKIHILNSDKLNLEALEKQKIPRPQGFGETFWISSYEIKHFLSRYTEKDSEKIVSYTYELINH